MDPKLTAELREMVLTLTCGFDPSLKSHYCLLKKLNQHLNNRDIPLQLVVIVVRLLARQLVHYQTTPFRETVLSILRAGLDIHGEEVLDAALDEIKTIAEYQLRNVNPSRSESGRSLLALSWSILLVETCKDKSLSLKLKGNNSKWQSLLSCQAALFYGCCASKKSSIEKSAKRKLVKLWKKIGKGCVDLFVDTVKQSDATSASVGLLGVLASVYSRKFCAQTEKFVKLYVKVIISARTKPPIVLVGMCNPALRFVDHEHIKTTLLPSIQKALLRNPENVLPVLFELFDAVSVDLSVHADVIFKSLARQLVSKEDSRRQLANKDLLSMGKQMSDAHAVLNIVKDLMGLLRGSEGKLTLPGQKMDIVSAIGGLSHCPVSSGLTRMKLTVQVIDQLASLLADTHEPTVILALNAITDWCKKYHQGAPDTVYILVKAGLAAKNPSSLIRASYIECVLDILIKDHIEKAGTLADLLFGIIDKGVAQPNRPPIVYEALCATHLIIILDAANYNLNATNLKKVYEAISNDKLQLFTSSKFVSQIETKGLHRLAAFCNKVLVCRAEKLGEAAVRMYCSTLIQLLLHESYSVRKVAAESVHNVQESSTVETFDIMLSEFQAAVKDREATSFRSSSEGYDAEQESIKKLLTQQRITAVLLLLLRVPDVQSFKNGATTHAINALLISHHPCIVAVRGDVWTDFLFKLGIDALEFIEKHCDDLMKVCSSGYEERQASVKNALSNLARIAPKHVMSTVLNTVRQTLQDPAITLVSEEDFKIMHFPKDQLFNKDIIKNTARIAENKNIKRENKAYSHKEQMEFLQLQKELEAKKSKERNTNPEANYGFEQTLTKKQIELVEAEMKKEMEIRENLQQIGMKVRMAMEYLISCISQPNCSSLASFMPDLVDIVLPLIPSLLASKLTQKLLLIVKDIINCDALHRLDVQLVYVTLRLYRTAADIPADWNAEDLNACACRITRILYNRSKIDGKNTSLQVPFSSACFGFVYPLLEKVLDGTINGVDVDDKVIVSALKIIKVHADRATDDEFGAKVLLCAKMLRKMKMFVEQNEGPMQKLACEVFVSICRAIDAAYNSYSEVCSEIEIIAECLLSSTDVLRRAALQGFKFMVDLLPKGSAEDTTTKMLASRLWISCYDLDEEASEMAAEIWRDLASTTTDTLCFELLNVVTMKDENIQEAAADALYAALESNLRSVPGILTSLMDLYNHLHKQIPVSITRTGVRTVHEEVFDEYYNRVGVAKALEKIAPSIPEDMVEKLFSFYVGSALRDPKAEVRTGMLQAALQAVENHGKTCTDDLMKIFQSFLKQAPDAENFDAVRQSVVILLGTLAHHLDKDDPRVKPIFAKLTEALSTPSQQVQEAVARCLTPLVPAIKADAPEIVKKLLLVLLGSENYGERKGAAYGLAGITKGLGIIAFKQLDIMNTLTDAIQDKKNYRHREGALMAFEMFCVMLGRLFEPYIVHVLPYLLLCFGDGNQYVREAADDTARAVMRNLSAHGVKLVLPSLLSALAEDSWRTKTGSVELLGAMAFCAPKQLSACLPSVVPQLCNVLTDSHPKVQKAGHQALKQIGSVIRNPEIQKITSVLLAALAEPFRNTSKCLQILLNTKFVHVIDAPSLALIMPVVNRAFENRSTDTRRMAAQIIGNMYSLTEQKDLRPYLASVVPGLKTSLLDPVPEVRTDASRALGAIVRGTGEELYEELLPWLMDTLTSERSSVDRSGAAQGIAEVLGALGVSKLEAAMPDIVKMASSSEVLPHVRDGYIMLYIYLPVTFEKEFTPFIGDIIPALLKSLADECEFLRDTALVAGQCIIGKYAEEAVPLLLPQLEQGMFDDNWRIRLSSIQLLGELLYQVSGVSGKMSTHGDEDDNFGTMEGQKAIQSVLGANRCHRVFSGLYIGRSDVMLQVRQAALHIWKIVVPNTPRVLREILPTLFEILLRCSASASYDRRQVAAKSMGDIVKKLGERMLPEIIPILDEESNSEDDDQRQGVCIALAEIINSCTKDAVLTFAAQLTPTIKRGLSDKNSEVSTAAAVTFQHFHSAVGNQALEDIIPDLLNQLDNAESTEHLVHGLREVIALKGRVVLPFIVPKLIQPPVNTHILAVLSSVAGESITKHLSKILKALLFGLVAASGDTDEYSATLKNCTDVILSVEGEHGNRIIMDDLIKYTKSENVGERLSATALLTAFCQSTEYDYSSYVAMFIQIFFKLLADKEVPVQEEAWSALSVLVKRLDAAEQLQHVGSLRQAMRYASDEIRRCGGLLPGFCNPKKGMAPVLPIMREGILNGASDTKEQCARALSECIALLTSQALKPSVISITGPLIRILSDRFNPKVRIAVLETLTLLLAKAGAFMKPFLPQLQTTFSKALHDADRAVRLQSGKGLKNLVAIQARLDSLFLDLNNSIKAESDPSVLETTLHALRCCIDVAGSKMSPKIRGEVISTLTDVIGSEEESCSRCACGCLGSLSSVLDEEEWESFLEEHVYDVDPSWNMRLARSTLLMICFKQNPIRICEKLDKVLPIVMEYANLERVEIVNNSLRCASYLLVFMVSQSKEVPNEVLKLYTKASQHASNDVKIFFCDSISYIYQSIEAKNGKENTDLTVPLELSASFVSLLLTFSKEKNTTVRSSMDIALVHVLDLKNTDYSQQNITQYMKPHDIPTLNDLVKSRLKKVASTNPTVEDIDFTFVKF